MIPPEFEFPGVSYSRHPGGQSGAAVYVGRFDQEPAFAVKRHTNSPERLRWIHARLQKTPEFVLKPIPTADSRTVVVWNDSAWDCTRWARGNPVREPTREQQQAAFAALAELHRGWPVEQHRPFPAIRRRLDVLRAPAWLYLPPDPDPAFDQALRERWMRGVQALDAWERLSVPCRPCLCDGHAEHLFFEGDRLAAIIDFAAMKLDHPAVDVARLAEDWDLCPAEATAWYRDAGGDPEVREQFVQLLAETATLAAWQFWLNRPGGEDRRVRLRRRLLRH